MAVCFHTNKRVCVLTLRGIAYLLNQKKLYSRNKPDEYSETETALDDFTTQLIQRKTSKWEYKKQLARIKCTNTLNTSVEINKQYENIMNLTTNEINLLLQKAVDFGDNVTLLDLTKQCVKYQKCPSLSLLLHMLSACSQKGDKETILEIVELCEKLQPKVLQENSNFEHYLAEAIWVRGNIVKSLVIFEKIYRENVYLRSRIRCILKNLIDNVLAEKSEASVVNIIKFSEILVREYGDYYPLECIWQTCLLSEWFTDHQMAFKLFEDDVGLRVAIIKRLPHVVNTSLYNHQTEVVYRLTEQLLKFNMHPQLPQVILPLLNYFFKTRDLRRCNELIKWSVKNDVELPHLVLIKKLTNILVHSDKVNDDYKLTKPTTKYKF